MRSYENGGSNIYCVEINGLEKKDIGIHGKQLRKIISETPFQSVKAVK